MDDRKGGTLFIQFRNSSMNGHFRLLYTPNAFIDRLKAQPPLNIDLPTIHSAINEFITKCENAHNSTNGLPFKYTPGSVGIATTCQLNALCVTSIMFAHYQTNGSIPIELWLNRSSTDSALINSLKREIGKMLHVRFFDEIYSKFLHFFGEKKPFDDNRYSLKTLVMVGSTFQHLIWMDSDVMFIRDPLLIIKSPLVNNSGMVLWRDIHCIHINNPIWNIMEVNARADWGGESGVVYINKEISWKSLYLTIFMNHNQNIFYRLLFYDKDTYFLASERLKEPYFMMPYAPVAIGDKKMFAFLQPDPDGGPLFVHLVGNAKRDFKQLIHKNKQPFTMVLNYDPERSHLSYCRKYFCAVSDRRRYIVPNPVPLSDYLNKSTLSLFGSYYKIAEKLVKTSLKK